VLTSYGTIIKESSMYRYLITALAISMCGCANHTVTPAAAPVAAEETPALGTPPATLVAITVELTSGDTASAMRCSDQLDCLQKLTGFCPNGYNGGRILTNGNNIVGTLFRCVTDQEKAQEAAENAREAAFLAAKRRAEETEKAPVKK